MPGHPRCQGTDEDAAVTADREPLAARQRRRGDQAHLAPRAGFGVLWAYAAAALAAGFLPIGRRDA